MRIAGDAETHKADHAMIYPHGNEGVNANKWKRSLKMITISKSEKARDGHNAGIYIYRYGIGEGLQSNIGLRIP